MATFESPWDVRSVVPGVEAAYNLVSCLQPTVLITTEGSLFPRMHVGQVATGRARIRVQDRLGAVRGHKCSNPSCRVLALRLSPELSLSVGLSLQSFAAVWPLL